MYPVTQSQAQGDVTSLTAPVDKAMAAAQREKRPLAASLLSVCLSVCPSVCLSVHMEQLGSRSTDFRSIPQADAEHSNTPHNTACFDLNQSHHLVQHYLNTSEKHSDRQTVQFQWAVKSKLSICQFRAFAVRQTDRQTDRHSAAHQTHTCAMIQSLTQTPLTKMTFLPYGGAVRPTGCIITKIEVLGDKSTLYIGVTLYWGHLIVLWLFYWCVSCTVAILTGFVMCGCVCMCVCVWVLYCVGVCV